MKYIAVGAAALAVLGFVAEDNPTLRNIAQRGEEALRIEEKTPSPWSRRLQGEIYKQIMLDRFRGTFREPESVQFRDVTVNPDGSIAGRVNARNGFGGMSGWREFRYGA